MRLLRSLFLLIFPSALCLAQMIPPAPPAAVYPLRQAQLSDLQTAANLSYSQLTAPANSTATSLTVQSPTVFPIPTTVTIDSEIIRICGKTTNTLTVCIGGRGAEGTSASQHSAGTYVEQRLTATFHNQMAAEVMATEKRGYNETYVTDYGAVCDGKTDDTNAIRAAIAASITGVNGEFLGGIVRFPSASNLPPQMPSASCGITGSIIIPAGVRLRGNGPVQGPFLVALPGGTWSTYEDIQTFTFHTFMLQVGQIQGGSNFGVSVEDLGIGANGFVDTCIWSENLEEGSGLFNVSVNGYTQFGVDFFGSGTQNSFIQTLSTAPAPGATNTTGLRWFGGNVRQRISDVTIQGGTSGGQQHAAGITVSMNGTLNNIHCEYQDICIDEVQGNIETSMVDCESTGTVPTCINIQPGVASTAIGTTNTGVIICDGSIPGTATCGGRSNVTSISAPGGYGLSFHATNAVISGYYLSLAAGVGARLPKLLIDTTIFAQSYNLAHETLSDTGEGAVLSIGNGNPLGLQIQSQKTTGYGTRDGCGLALNGGGYAGDPSFGSTIAGAVFDGGTASACAPTASGILMGGGRGVLFANLGLSVDYQFTPTAVMNWSSYGVQFGPSPTAPPCAGVSDHGRLWINSSTTPNRVEFCMDNGWQVVTTTTGP